MDFFPFIIVQILLNFIGGTIRWAYGSIWRSIFNKPKFTYKEYINGIKNTRDYYSRFGHELNNCIIGAIFLAIILIIAIK